MIEALVERLEAHAADPAWGALSHELAADLGSAADAMLQEARTDPASGSGALAVALRWALGEDATAAVVAAALGLPFPIAAGATVPPLLARVLAVGAALRAQRRTGGLSVAEVGARLRVGRSRVLQLRTEAGLTAWRDAAGAWRFDAAAVERHIQRPRGRPGPKPGPAPTTVAITRRVYRARGRLLNGGDA